MSSGEQCMQLETYFHLTFRCNLAHVQLMITTTNQITVDNDNRLLNAFDVIFN